MVKLKAGELSPAGRRGRNSIQRGAAAERSLTKLLSETYGLPVKRVARSGALKFSAGQMTGKADNYRGDVQLQLGEKNLRIEVKTRVKLPMYITSGMVKEIQSYCQIFTLKQFINVLFNGEWDERLDAKVITDKRCKGLINWFKQDDSDIVAMKETGKQTWYFAVRNKVIDRIARAYGG